MQLKSYYGKEVYIIASNGKIFWGHVEDYFYPEDNESGIESIVIVTKSGDLVEFDEESIYHIAVC